MVSAIRRLDRIFIDEIQEKIKETGWGGLSSLHTAHPPKSDHCRLVYTRRWIRWGLLTRNSS